MGLELKLGIDSARRGRCVDAKCTMAAPRRQDPQQCALHREQIAAVLAALRAGEHVDHDAARFCSIAWYWEHGRFVEVAR